MVCHSAVIVTASKLAHVVVAGSTSGYSTVTKCLW